METKDLILYGAVAVLLLILSVMYFKKKGSAKKSLAEAELAMRDGNDSVALLNLLNALDDANETPDLELQILDKIDQLYRKNQIQFDLSNYRTLVENSRVLLRKTSKKSEKEFLEIDNLKHKIRGSMPSIKEGDVVEKMRELSKAIIEDLKKK